MYIAEGNLIFYSHPTEETMELFITVHPTRDCAPSPAEQAARIADVLNFSGWQGDRERNSA